MSEYNYAQLKRYFIDWLTPDRLEKAGITEDIVLINKIFQMDALEETHSGLMVGGPKVAYFMIMGEHSGRFYMFSVKKIVEDMNK